MAAWPTPLSSGRFCSWLAAFRRNSPATSWKRDDRFADAADAGVSDPHLRNDPTISNENLARELSRNVLVRCRDYAAAVSSIVLYGLASRSTMSILMIGQAGSNSLVRKLNFGLRGNP